jgi:hypothetical protein
MPRINLRWVFRPIIVAGLALAIPLTAVLPAAAVTLSPASLAAASPAQHHGRAVVPANFPPAYDTKTEFLTDNPTVDLPNSCVGRDIYLAAGDYQWDYKMGGEEITQSGGTVSVSGGGYSWETCIYTQNGYYQMTSSLTSFTKDANGDPIETHDLRDINIQLFSSGDYNWGSVLIPLF